MKLQIVNNGQEKIGGYETATIEKPNDIDLNNIVTNSCESILASDVVDMFHPNNIKPLCQVLVQKLRLNGELVLGGTEVRLFAKNLINGLLTPTEASNMVTNIYSMSCVDTVKETLESLGLSISSIHMDGVHYEIKAVRT